MRPRVEVRVLAGRLAPEPLSRGPATSTKGTEMRTRTRITLAGLALGAALAGGVAWATIPADSGLYTACKLKATGHDPADRPSRPEQLAPQPLHELRDPDHLEPEGTEWRARHCGPERHERRRLATTGRPGRLRVPGTAPGLATRGRRARTAPMGRTARTVTTDFARMGDKGDPEDEAGCRRVQRPAFGGDSPRYRPIDPRHGGTTTAYCRAGEHARPAGRCGSTTGASRRATA